MIMPPAQTGIAKFHRPVLSFSVTNNFTIYGERRMKILNIKSILLAGAAAVLAGAISVPSAIAADEPTRGGRLVVGQQNGIGGFDPLKALSFASGRLNILNSVYEKLFEFDQKTGKILPVQGLTATPSDDFKKWRVTLRPGVKFSNGEEMTSEAWTVHWDRLLNSKFAGRYRFRLMGIFLESVTAVDKYTIDFTFREPHAGFMNVLASPINSWWVTAPSHTKKMGKHPDYNAQPIGAGPYMLKEWRDGVGVTLVRNPHYWRPETQHVDEIFYMTIPNEPARFKALQAGTIDVMSVTAGYLDDIEKDNSINRKTGPALNASFMVSFNNGKPPFDDVRVRKALAHALDRGALTKVGGGPERPAQTDWYGPGHPWHCPDVKWPEYNPEKAKALLKEYGQPIKLVLNHFPVVTVGRTAEAIADSWRKVGVEASVKKGGRGLAYLRPLLSGKFDIFTFVGGMTTDPALVAAYYHSKHPSNRMFNIKDPIVDAAYEAVKNARGEAERRKASCAYQQTLVDQQRYIGWQVEEHHLAFRKRVGGVTGPFTMVFDAHKMWVGK